MNVLLTAHGLQVLANVGNPSYVSSIGSVEQILSFQKSRLSKTVNHLWYSALGFSLSSVFVAMLAKQWLAAYNVLPPDEPVRVSHDQQRKFDGLHNWSLPTILAVLPALLHISLFLFLAGLIIHLWDLDSVISVTTCVILGHLVIFYFVTGVLAVFYPNCPYKTPISQCLRSCFRGSHNSEPDPIDHYAVKAIVRLTNTNDPETVSQALQSLAGLRRGSPVCNGDQAVHIARLALEHLKTCFIAEWRHRSTFNLRTEKQYEASCYLRTLMHFVDGPYDSNTSRFETIIADPALPIFIRLLGDSAEPNIAILALCDHQRLLHHIESVRFLSARVGDNRAVPSGRHNEAVASMEKVILILNQYIHGHYFLHSFAIELAVDTIGRAPLAWAVNFSGTQTLYGYLIPIMELLKLTRGSCSGVRSALARTLTVLSQIHAIDVLPNPEADFVARFEHALDISATLGDGSDDDMQKMLLLALSRFLVSFGEQENLADNFFDEICYECDRRVRVEQAPSDNTAIASLLPLLASPSLSGVQRSIVATRLYSNAVTASEPALVGSIKSNITQPSNSFPSDTVSVLVRTLDDFKRSTDVWLGDTSSLLYMVSHIPPHRKSLLDHTHTLINIVRVTDNDEVANHIFWILTCLLREAVESSDRNMIQVLTSAGMVAMLRNYSEGYGLIPADVHAWVDILAPSGYGFEMIPRRSLIGMLYAGFRDLDEPRSAYLFQLRERIYQFSRQHSRVYTAESALAALNALSDTYGEGQITSSIIQRRNFRRELGGPRESSHPRVSWEDISPVQGMSWSGNSSWTSIPSAEQHQDGVELNIQQAESIILPCAAAPQTTDPNCAPDVGCDDTIDRFYERTRPNLDHVVSYLANAVVAVLMSTSRMRREWWWRPSRPEMVTVKP